MEYKQQAFTAIKKLLDSIQHNTVNTLFKAQVNLDDPRQTVQERRVDVNKMQTNDDAIEGNITKSNLRRPSAQSAVAQRISANSPSQSPSVPEVGRNDDCPCGSGKKYKKCCGK